MAKQQPHRDLESAQHEAAHITVGGALGMRMRRAVLEQQPGWEWSGGVWFDGRASTTEAWGLMLAAGVAWERALGKPAYRASCDLRILREMGVGTRARVHALTVASAAILAGLGTLHARITRELLDRDLDGQDFDALVRGDVRVSE